MRVVCPACAATYEVPASVVEARRTLRCTGCGSQFPAGASAPSLAPRDPPPSAAPSAPAPAPAPAATAPAAPVGGALDAGIDALRVNEAARLPVSGEAAARPPRVRAAVIAGWVVSLLLLAAGASAAVVWRQPIMRAWPPSTRAYAALGMLH